MFLLSLFVFQLNSDIGKLYWERKDVVFSSGSGIFTTQAQIDSRMVVGWITNNNANIGVGTITVSGYDATIRLTDGTISGTYAVSLFYKSL